MNPAAELDALIVSARAEATLSQWCCSGLLSPGRCECWRCRRARGLEPDEALAQAVAEGARAGRQYSEHHARRSGRTTRLVEALVAAARVGDRCVFVCATSQMRDYAWHLLLCLPSRNAITLRDTRRFRADYARGGFVRIIVAGREVRDLWGMRLDQAAFDHHQPSASWNAFVDTALALREMGL